MVRTPFAAYGIALLVVAVAIGLRLVAEGALKGHFPFITLFPAIVFAAWYGGRNAGLVATAAGALAADALLLPPEFSLGIAEQQNRVGLLLFCIVGGGMALLMGSLRTQIRRAIDERELLEITFASIGDALITTDAQGRILRMNSVAESLTASRIGAVEGQPLSAAFEIISEQARLPLENPVTRALRDEQSVVHTYAAILKGRDGFERFIDANTGLIRRPDGTIIGCVLVFRDITARRELETLSGERYAAARQLACIVESSDDAIITKSLDGIIEGWNTAAERLFGYGAAEIIGLPITTLIPMERRDEAVSILSRIRAGIRVEPYDTVRVRKDGRMVPVSLSVSPIKDEDGHIIGASKIARDNSERMRAEAALLRSERELSDFFVNAAIGIQWIAPDGTVLKANKAQLDLLGYTEDEYIGRPIANFHVDSHALREMLAELAAGRQVITCETRMRCKNGETRAVVISASGFWQNDTMVHLRCFIRDVTAQMTAEETSRFSEAMANERTEELRAVLRAAPIPILIAHDSACNVMTGNPAFLRLLGARSPAAGVDRESGSDVLLDNDDILVSQLRDALMSKVTHSGIEMQGMDLEVRFRSDDPRHVIGSAAPLRNADGAVRGCIAAFIDVTPLKNVESALRETDSRKNEFLATLAHELRNPLAPLMNSLELLKRAEADGQFIEQARTIMARQIEHMVRLIDDLVDVGRITRDKLELRKERVALQTVVQHAVDGCRVHCDRHRQDLQVQLPPMPIYLEADPVRLTQVFSNLLINSSKYTDAGGTIGVTATLHGSEVRVFVQDSGIGIPSDMLTKIFDLFTQVDVATERSGGGLGIGLSLVKRLVELHGGSVTARSGGAGQGSEFEVCLPVTNATVIDDTRDVIEAPLADFHRRILVVDDNHDSAESLMTLLQLSGNQVVMAHDGMRALELAKSLRPDIILLDLGLPHLDGYEVCRAVRNQAWGKDVVIVALSGWGQDEDRRRSTEAGFDFHLVKPIDFGELMDRLTSLAMPCVDDA